MTTLPTHCRKAIRTRYLGPTNFRGSRIVADAEGDHRYVSPWDDALPIQQNHAAAAHALATRLGWHGTWVMGATADAYVFVLMDQDAMMVVVP